jgi:hypothetical protein
LSTEQTAILMKNIFRPLFIAAAVASVFSPTPTQAGITVIGPTSSTAGSFQITEDITFTITTAGKIRSFVLDEWVTSDGSWTFALLSSILDPTGTPLLISINHATPFANSYSHFIDNHYSGTGITPNDGYFYLDPTVSVSIGDTVTLKAGTYGLLPISGFNPQATQVFTGNMFITDTNGNRASNIVAVPEPQAVTLLMGAAAISAALHRRRAVGAFRFNRAK